MATTKRPAKPPAKPRETMKNVRLSEDEARDLDAIIAAWEADAAAHGFQVAGFSHWFRWIMRREKAALAKKEKAD